METSFKSRSFLFVFWIIIILILVDLFDTFNRVVVSYFTTGAVSLPGGSVVEISGIILVLVVPLIIAVLYGTYLLYKRKKVGGYWVLGANFLFFISGFIVGPFAEHASEVLLFSIIYFIIMIVVVIGVPRFYSDKFE